MPNIVGSCLGRISNEAADRGETAFDSFSEMNGRVPDDEGYSRFVFVRDAQSFAQVALACDDGGCGADL